MAQAPGARGPKYRRIAEDLLASIRRGDYPPGGQLPTKAELMARYDVAVNTVERAIKELRAAGVVETAQGAGTFVRDAAAVAGLGKPIGGGAASDGDGSGQLARLVEDMLRLERRVDALEARAGDRLGESAEVLAKLTHEVQEHAQLIALIRGRLDGIPPAEPGQRDEKAM
jgi:DNA-binding transcriptional MocR family regulator